MASVTCGYNRCFSRKAIETATIFLRLEEDIQVTTDVSAERQLRLLQESRVVEVEGHVTTDVSAERQLRHRLPPRMPGGLGRVTTDVSAERQLRLAAFDVVKLARKRELQPMFQPKGN